MQATINFLQSAATASNKVLKGMIVSAKETLLSETMQKMLLFTIILGLLFIAANLEHIL